MAISYYQVTMEEFVKSLFEYTVMAKILQLEVKCDVTNNIEQGFIFNVKNWTGVFFSFVYKKFYLWSIFNSSLNTSDAYLQFLGLVCYRTNDILK